jgi:hypothetical protein
MIIALAAHIYNTQAVFHHIRQNDGGDPGPIVSAFSVLRDSHDSATSGGHFMSHLDQIK